VAFEQAGEVGLIVEADARVVVSNSRPSSGSRAHPAPTPGQFGYLTLQVLAPADQRA
jgi:hypothetical protein